ncbi:MAG: hypothetical protein QOH63_434 [Acidobacteriota bacterium]|jgi:uncharacterized protein (TIGR00725 family)|nr:hypothetical protein [Acidobacteriota bacterium]
MNNPSRRSPQATVIGDSDASPEISAVAESIGVMLARLNITVVTGGRGGVMEATSRGARNAGGIAIGILPSVEMSEANSWCSVVIPTGLGHARNVLTVLAGDFLIAIGSSAGTLSELCFAWIHGKPILTLKGYGTWSDKIGSLSLDHRNTSSITECSNLEELEKVVIETCKKMNLIALG